MNINKTDTINKIFNIIKEKNKGRQALNDEELSEQDENIHDFNSLLQSVDKQISILEKVKHDNNATIEGLLLLRSKVLDFIWHYEQLDDLLLKLIRTYDFQR